MSKSSIQHLHDLVAYGTLCDEALLYKLIRRRFAAEHVVILDHVCRRLKDRPYPGIRPEITTHTSGVIYRDLDDESLKILDKYEDLFYQRSVVRVRFSNGEIGQAMAYVLLEQFSGLMTDELWNSDQANQRSTGR